MSDLAAPDYLDRTGRPRLAYRFTPGALSLSLMDDYGKLVRGQL